MMIRAYRSSFSFINIIVKTLLVVSYVMVGTRSADTDTKSPYNQHLPDCLKTNFPVIHKKTDKKGIVCPMVKDEVGFLSEWVGFYEMQGFNHIIFFDNNSTTSFAEIDPWLKSGFVSIERNWWASEKGLFSNKKNKFYDMMKIKMMAEVQCKKQAVEWGYEVFVSLDMDEYLMPSTNSMTVMDELSYWFETTTRGMAMISKLQFPPVPHILEPINMLTIEAYQTRMSEPGKMNYYTSVSNKVALRLIGSKEYSNATTEYLIHCCDFHGCGNFKFYGGCGELFKAGEKWKFDGKHRKWLDPPHIHHYARSLEKYIMKQTTWDTAGAGRDYDIFNFMDRVLGSKFDDSAVTWGCQLRELLRNRTGEADYIRPGDEWYHNPEFGRLVSNPRKRGRNGAALGKYLAPHEMNPYPIGDTYQRSHKPYKAQPAAAAAAAAHRG